jgi:hypothetical protein
MEKETVKIKQLKNDIQTYLFLDDDIDLQGWSDDYIEKMSKIIVEIMLAEEIIEEDEVQEYDDQPDYGATAAEVAVFLDEDEKQQILDAYDRIYL